MLRVSDNIVEFRYSVVAEESDSKEDLNAVKSLKNWLISYSILKGYRPIVDSFSYTKIIEPEDSFMRKYNKVLKYYGRIFVK